MEVHNRFLKLPTMGINILETLTDNRDKESQIIRELVETYNKKILNNVLDLKTLETFRMILCYEYQSIHSHNKNEPFKCQGRLYTDLRILFIKNNEYRKNEEFSILYDIVVLQLVLSNKTLLKKSFKDFWDTEGILSNTEYLNLAMKVSECFADSYNLHTYLYKSSHDSAELEEQLTRILTIIQLWMKQKESLEWKLLASLLPKLIVTFEPQKIISPLWQHILGSMKIEPPFTGKNLSEITDLEEKLTVLCVMADVCFPSEIEQVKQFHYEQCLQDEFWCILNRGLISKNFQQRKQALYLVKRALEFVEINKSAIKKRLKPLQKIAMPFLCTKSEDQASSLEEVKKNFFLILEVLEEKQKHLVLPALSHLTSLVKVQNDHEFCCDFFNPIWLRCIYRRIVQHDNDSVKIFGLQAILKSDPHIFFDDEFLLFFVDALNNTFLYEYNDKEEKPQIVKQLEASFLIWEQKKITLINSFVKTLPSVSWGPVAIYWIIQALLAITDQCKIVTNVWGDAELHYVENLIQKSLMTHNLQLRTYSQILIIRTLIAYTSMAINPSSLECIFNILCSFPDNKNFECGAKEWKAIAKHLSKIIRPSDAVQYITQRCEKILMVTQNMNSLARIILVLADAELIFVDKSCPVMKMLQNLYDNLIEADVRPYADKRVTIKISELAGHCRNFRWLEGYAMNEISIQSKPYTYAILKIVCKSLEEKTISKNDKYVLVINTFLSTLVFDQLSDKDREQLYNIQNKCIVIITNPYDYCKTQWFYAIKMLLTCCEKFLIMNEWKFGFAFIPLLLQYFRIEIIDNRQEENVAHQKGSSKGILASDCPETIAKLLLFFFKRSFSKLWSLDVDWLDILWMLVNIENEQVISPVINILQIVLYHNAAPARHDLDRINCIVGMSYRIIFQLKKTPVTLTDVDNFIGLITSEEFLKLDDSKEYAIEFIDQIMRESEKMPLLKLRLVQSSPNKDIICCHMAFTSCLLHGAVPRRDQRIELAAMSHGQILSSSKQFATLDTNPLIRLTALDSLISSRCKPDVQNIILNNLLEILEQNKNKRYFDNSHLHRLKQRLMQTLLVQEPCLNKPQKQRLYDALCDLLIAESNQPSVRLMHEWLLIRLCLKNAEMRETMWKLFNTAAEKRPGSIVSLASVVFHVARKLSGKTQTEYIVKAISQLLPNCMGQQFNVRLYSQTILLKIYNMLPKDCSEVKTYKQIFESVEESLRRGNLMKNSTKVLDHFYFTIFDPVLDFNMETIYYDLPRLTNVYPDELIPTNFLSHHQTRYDKNYLEFTECRDLLRVVEPSAQSSKPTGELEESAESNIDGGLSDVQKKIIPWKTMVPFSDDLSEISKTRLLRRKTQNEEAGIIVVASLIDRPPNLGGIARTCEIFGVKELVIGSLRYAEDPEFQTLSVSAEKWITITEVKPHLMQNYLLEKQSEGWELVGAEQTANSTNLLEMVFPKKTILLLGNEKDGIPANLIPLLDTCVEIPQNGVVRSLNVHVTGAICIWQYAKQHVLT